MPPRHCNVRTEGISQGGCHRRTVSLCGSPRGRHHHWEPRCVLVLPRQISPSLQRGQEGKCAGWQRANHLQLCRIEESRPLPHRRRVQPQFIDHTRQVVRSPLSVFVLLQSSLQTKVLPKGRLHRYKVTRLVQPCSCTTIGRLEAVSLGLLADTGN